MRPPELAEPRGSDLRGRTPRWYEFRTPKSVVVFAVVVASGWALFIGVIGVMARLFVGEADRPSWGEVAGATAYNAVLLFVVALLLSLAVHLVMRRRAAVGKPVAVAKESHLPASPGVEATEPPPSPPTSQSSWQSWTIGGHNVVPSTIEGRLALLASLLVPVPFVAGVAMLAAPVLLVLAWRRGDRGLLLLFPLLVMLFVVFFVVAEFTVGHD